jgi:hypothetical protein
MAEAIQHWQVNRHEDEEIDFLTIQEAAELLRIPVAPGDVGLPLMLCADRGEAARSAAPVVLRAVPTSRLGAGRSERIKAGLERRKASGLPVGRAVGARDRKPRKRSGYFKRWEEERQRASYFDLKNGAAD